MKKILLALLFIPAVCHAQVAEMSVKGGVVFNSLKGYLYGTDKVKQPVNYGGGVALTFGLPAGFRVGLALSIYEVKADAVGFMFEQHYPSVMINEKSTISYGKPMMPLEALLMKRFNIGRIRLDIGAVGGMSLNKTYSFDYADEKNDIEFVSKTGNWYTYGALLGAQYRLGCRWAIGVEGQAKSLKLGSGTPVALYPVMAKISYSL